MNLFLALTIICLVVQAFFAMMEMAIVSLNRVRLQYYLVEGDKRALWISRMLQDPTRLFATTLIGVNTALQIGSECSRQFYISMDLDPDLAPLTQIVIVLIFAELAPLFAARRHSESVSMIGIAPLYLLSILMAPFTFLLGRGIQLLDQLFGKEKRHAPFISKEELQKAIESLDEKHVSVEEEDFNHLVHSIFSLKAKTPRDFMTPLDQVLMIPTGTKIRDLKRLLRDQNIEHLPVYYHQRHTIVGIVSTRNLLKSNDDSKCDAYMTDGWFVLESESVFKVIDQFKKNGQPLAIIVNSAGMSLGVVHLDQILQSMFLEEKGIQNIAHVMIDRSFDVHADINKLNQQFDLDLPLDYGDTLLELLEGVLGKSAANKDSVRMKNVEITMYQGEFMGETKVHIRTILP